MCKSVLSKRPRTGAARLFFTVAAAAVVSALVLVGCGGNKGNPASGGGGYTLTVSVDPDTANNRVLRDPNQETYKDGDSVSLKAEPGFKHKFIYWSGAVLDSVNPVKFAVKGNWKVNAHFKRYYTITVNRTRGGAVSYDRSKTEYFAGDTVTLTAAAESGNMFVGWTDSSGTLVSVETSLTVTVRGDTTLIAGFQQVGCVADPYMEGCPLYCSANPNAPECAAPPDPCDVNPSAPGCVAPPSPCDVNPSAQGCPGYCTANPSALGCPGYCAANPSAPGCQSTSDYTLTVGKNPPEGGTVSYESKPAYAPGETVSVTAVANTGYVFVGWSGASEATTPTVSIMMDGNKTLTANFQLKPEGHHTLTVVKNPEAGGTVLRNPDETTYPDGEDVTLAAVPEDGYEFTGWSGASEAKTDAVIITMDGDKTITANFKLKEYTLAIEIDPTDGGTVSSPDPIPNAGGKYQHGATVSVTAAAKTGYVFAGWTGASEAATPTVTITMDDDKTLTANFELIPEGHRTLTFYVVPSVGGDVSREPDKTTYPDGEDVTLTATAADGYEFANWSGASTAATPTVTITMDGDKELTAKFKRKEYTLTIDVYPPASGDVSRSPVPNSAGKYEHGQMVTVTARAAEGYIFNYWSGAETGNKNPVTITMNGDKILIANFAKAPVDPCSANPNGPGCGVGTVKFCYWPASPPEYPTASCEQIGVTGCTGSTCSEADCEADYGTVITDCANPPVPTYCDYGFGNCISVASAANCNQYGVVTSSCPAATGGYYCDYGQPTQYGNGGCYWKPGITPSGTQCGPKGDGDLEYAKVVTMEACITSNTTNPTIKNPCNPGEGTAGGGYECE